MPTIVAANPVCRRLLAACASGRKIKQRAAATLSRSSNDRGATRAAKSWVEQRNFVGPPPG